MNSETVDAVTDWESRPFSGGYEGLRGLAEREFSGAVTQGTAWAFMINGRLVGIEDGSLSAFEGADGAAYEAPHRGLPLLYAMQGSGEKQAEYYTNKKSISEADKTLSSGGFTGYIELSENVLSGDYYTVYYGGKSMSVAFVGNSRQLLTDEEAFERADDEVGIYTVYAADLEVIDIPEPAGEADDEPTTTDDTQPTADEPAETTTESGSSGGVGGVTPTPEASVADSSSSGGGATTSSGSVTPDGSAADGSTGGAGSAASGGSTAGNGTVSQSKPETSANGRTGATSAAGSSAAGSAASESESDVFSNEAEWRNAKTIPSLDPSSDSDSQARQSGSTRSASTASGSRSSATGGSASQLSRKQLRKRLKRAEQVMDKAEQQHEQLVEERDAAIAERDEAREELESVRQQLSEAEAEVEQLREQIESGSATSTSGHSGGQSMSPSEALEGTNLLVRYASKGEATLEDAISGAADREEVRTNLRIEPHTTFDSEGASVDGTPFETFLDGRIELAFTRWLVEEFLFDIQDTGNQTALKGIYETLPAINRAELRGTVSLGTDEEGDEIEAAFDLVVRDKRDEPLFVADFNESKQPVGGGMVNSLVRDGSEIIQDNESFAGAFAVTTSYYEGAALDAAADATGGGLLSASRGKSFVYISRKQGFHLCLVEKLGDDFDLHVPEL